MGISVLSELAPWTGYYFSSLLEEKIVGLMNNLKINHPRNVGLTLLALLVTRACRTVHALIRAFLRIYICG